MKFSARNVFTGTIKEITNGPVHSEVVIELPGGQEITSIITRGSADMLGIKVGGKASAIIKASAVIVAVD